MSATQSTLGAAGRKSRSTRSSATLTPGTRIVVRPRFFVTRPLIPACAISRSTRFRETLIPCAIRSSAWMRGRTVDAAVVARGSRRMRSVRKASLSARWTGARPLPAVEGRAVDAEHPAHQRDRVVGLLRGDEPIGIGHRPSLSRAKKAAAFFRISRSCSEGAVLTAQAPELLSLLGAQALALAGVDVGLFDPFVQGLIGDPQVLGELGDRLAR